MARGGGERTIQKRNESETSQKHFPDLGGDHYVISLLLSQTSSRWETNGRVPKCRLFSQVILSVECAVQQIRLSLLIVLLFTNKVSVISGLCRLTIQSSSSGLWTVYHMSDKDVGEIYILKYFTFCLGAMTYTATSMSSKQLRVPVLVQFYPWFKYFISFVSNSLTYITIPQNKGKQNLNQ